MILGITGRAGSGKDTVASIVQELYPELNWQIKGFADKLRQVASLLTGIPAEEMKRQGVKEQILGAEWDYAMFGDKILSIKSAKQECTDDGNPWRDSYRKNMAVRNLLQWVGTDGMRDNVHEDVWVNALFADYVAKKKEGGFQRVVKHGGYPVDFQYEVDFPNWLVCDTRFPNELEAITSRGGICIRIVRPDNPYPKSDHISETALDGVELVTIINDGNIEQLRMRVKEVFDPIVKNLGK